MLRELSKHSSLNTKNTVVAIPVDSEDDVVEHQVAEKLQTDVGWKRPPPPFLPAETRGFGFEIPFFTGTFGPQIRTWR